MTIQVESLTAIWELLKAVRNQTREQNQYLRDEIEKLDKKGPLKLYQDTMAQVKVGESQRYRVDFALGYLQKRYDAEIKKHSDLEKANKKLEEGIRRIQENIKLKELGQFKPRSPPPEEAENESQQGGRKRKPTRRRKPKLVAPAKTSQAES